MSNSVQPHRRQPSRLPHPWDSPGKNTGVGCHFLLQCMKVKSESEVAQLCLTLSDPMDCSLPGSSIHGIFQARVLERGAIAFFNEHCLIIEENNPPDILWIHWRVYNFIANTSKGILFLPPSDAYVRSFLYILYTLIKLYYTKALSDQASSLAPD